jgi:hypothetical protein
MKDSAKSVIDHALQFILQAVAAFGLERRYKMADRVEGEVIIKYTCSVHGTELEHTPKIEQWDVTPLADGWIVEAVFECPLCKNNHYFQMGD